MSDKEKIIISDTELIQYLDIASKVLTISKTELDITRLKSIITALRNYDYEVIHDKNTSRIATKKDAKIFAMYIEKIHNGDEVTSEERMVFEEFCNNNHMLKLAVNKSYEELFEKLSNQKNVSKSDVTLVYQYLIGNFAKAIKFEKMIDDVKQHIYKIKNFDDMDFRFAQKQNQKEEKLVSKDEANSIR